MSGKYGHAFQVTLHSASWADTKTPHRAFITEDEAIEAARGWLDAHWRAAAIQVGTWWSATPDAPAFFVASKDKDPLLIGELIPGTIEETDGPIAEGERIG